MSQFTLTPAYGRDYKSKKAVQADLDANVDPTWSTSGELDGVPIILSVEEI